MSALETVLKLLASEDSYSAIDWLARRTDPGDAMALYLELVKHLYWQEKNTPRIVDMSRAGIQHGLTTAIAIEAEDEAKAYDLRSSAKALAYNLASFTWPGWDEEGVVLTAADVNQGLEAAALNLRLAHTLDKGALALSRATWMLGAQQMAGEDYQQAEASFSEAADWARQGDTVSESLLAEAFEALAQWLHDPASGAAPERLSSLTQQLQNVEHGDAFIAQVETARSVFFDF
ncbi:MAG: hypothetical protein GY759_23420 [Chloroflexi bacterium]|nr:hypothetical protein [Chloroflexota bacterium]